MKFCRYCKTNKNEIEFGKSIKTKDGLARYCFSCERARSKYYNDRRKNRLTTYNCIICENNITIQTNKFKKKKILCCRKCSPVYYHTGKKIPRQKKEDLYCSKGYKQVRTGEFYASGHEKLKKEHIFVYEKFLGRELRTKFGGGDCEQIHHIDGDKLNNDISNLILCENSSEHCNIEFQLKQMAYSLVRHNVILFDKDNKRYYLQEDFFKVLKESYNKGNFHELVI